MTTATAERPTCLLLMSCLSVGPHYFLRLSDDFHSKYKLKIYANHRADTIPEHMAELEEEIHASAAFIHHAPDAMPYLGSKRTPYEEMLARIPPNVVKISFPHPHLHVFWPFHMNEERNNDPHRAYNRFGIQPSYAYGDSYVLRQIRDGVPPAEILDRYLALDVGEIVDLDAKLASTLSLMERNDRTTDIKITDFVADDFCKNLLFYSIGHPNNRLHWYMANRALEILGCRQVPEDILARTQELQEEPCPVHPSIPRHFGITYIDENTRYEIDRIRYLNFAEYMRDYIYFQ